jgi:hypothetical protein
MEWYFYFPIWLNRVGALLTHKDNLIFTFYGHTERHFESTMRRSRQELKTIPCSDICHPTHVWLTDPSRLTQLLSVSGTLRWAMSWLLEATVPQENVVYKILLTGNIHSYNLKFKNTSIAIGSWDDFAMWMSLCVATPHSHFCMCVCVCIYIYTYTHIYTHTHIHVHPAAWNFVHQFPRYASTTIYHCIALLHLLYRWQHQSRNLWTSVQFPPSHIPEFNNSVFQDECHYYVQNIYSFRTIRKVPICMVCNIRSATQLVHISPNITAPEIFMNYCIISQSGSLMQRGSLTFILVYFPVLQSSEKLGFLCDRFPLICYLSFVYSNSLSALINYSLPLSGIFKVGLSKFILPSGLQQKNS